MLHTLTRSPWQMDFPAFMRSLSDGDDVLLLQDGVVVGIQGSSFLDLLQQAPISVHALNNDVIARGLSGQISTTVDRVSYNDFVRLAIKHPSQMNW
ncbi:sulfurtransferase complex subunit TusB [Atlantibacter hermannii]|uniref:sulfurtransferase complex subunit TusB n=1 Tax=Atlantibacter hermannii TaxID=565 RepID=UPI002802430A|nr:sulfurtransferase complex subunit TusB [Atlantibacter hermannii]MDQ7882502.1 sulfurtransferase complex subunit TusB [Atlantibacter hermannii]